MSSKVGCRVVANRQDGLHWKPKWVKASLKENRKRSNRSVLLRICWDLLVCFLRASCPDLLDVLVRRFVLQVAAGLEGNSGQFPTCGAMNLEHMGCYYFFHPSDLSHPRSQVSSKYACKDEKNIALSKRVRTSVPKPRRRAIQERDKTSNGIRREII